jgi:hypothetical protein
MGAWCPGRPVRSVIAGRLASLERWLLGDVSPASVGHFSPGKIAFMVRGRIHARWAVRLSIARRGGSRSWLEVSGDFERSLVELASKTVIMPRIDAETRRGRDYVRVTLAMTIVAGDVAEALDGAWRAFQQASRGSVRDWDMTSASAEVLPEGTFPRSGTAAGS